MRLHLLHDALASRARIEAHYAHKQEEEPTIKDLAQAERRELGMQAAAALLQKELQPTATEDSVTVQELEALYNLPSAEKN